jgi:hypothetical protein
MSRAMDDPAPPVPPRVPPVEPDLLGSAIFLFAEYLQRIADETPPRDEDEEDDEEEEEDDEDETPSPINMRDVLDLFAEELGTTVPVTLTLYMRVTALYRLLAASPSLARLASDSDEGESSLNEDALVAAARLDLHVTRSGAGAGAVADFDPRQFRDALTSS